MIAPSVLAIEDTYARVGERFVRAIAVVDYPYRVEANWLADVFRYSGDLAISVHLVPAEKEGIVKQFSNAIGEAEARLISDSNPRRRQLLAQEKADAERLLRSLDVEQMNVYYHHMYLLLSARSLEELEQQTRILQGLLGGKGLRTRICTLQVEDGLTSCLPVCRNELPAMTRRNMPAETLAGCFPFSSAELSMGSGVLKAINKSTNSVVLLDRFTCPNANEVVLASSGGGKSFYVKLDAYRHWLQGVQVFILDPEREYRRLCLKVGGQYINTAPGAGHLVNPLEFSPAPLDDDLDDEQLAELQGVRGSPLALAIQRAKVFFGLCVPDISPREKAALDTALRAAYRACGIDFDVPPEPFVRFPTAGDVVRELEALGAHSLAASLKPMVDGSEAALFNGQTNVRLDADLVVIDLHELQDTDAQTPAMFNWLTKLWDIVRQDRSRRKIIYVDEAWLLADKDNPAAMRFLRDMAKRIRKYSGAIVTVTQNLADFLSAGKYGSAIINNAYTKTLLRQEANDLEQLTPLLRLSEREQALLRGADRGEGILMAGHARAYIQTVASREEREIIEAQQGGRS